MGAFRSPDRCRTGIGSFVKNQDRAEAGGFGARSLRRVLLGLAVGVAAGLAWCWGTEDSTLAQARDVAERVAHAVCAEYASQGEILRANLAPVLVFTDMDREARSLSFDEALAELRELRTQVPVCSSRFEVQVVQHEGDSVRLTGAFLLASDPSLMHPQRWSVQARLRKRSAHLQLATVDLGAPSHALPEARP
jgi:hypothetical protein